MAPQDHREEATTMGLQDVAIHPGIAVSDMTRATEFYEGKLGLSGGEETEDGGKTYRCGHGTTLHIFPSRYIARSEATRAGWEAGDRFEELIDELTSNGLVFEQYEEPKTDERGVVTFGEVKVAYFRDPDGNTFGLTNQ
jgi:catechol 2,3-dioxygenase-like lactoylglutathione lyase family enzyme